MSDPFRSRRSDDAGAALLLIPVILFASFLLTLWRAYAVQLVWNWFLPAALGVPYLGYIPAAAMCLIAGGLTYHVRGGDEDENPFKTAAISALYSLLIIVFAWVLTLML